MKQCPFPKIPGWFNIFPHTQTTTLETVNENTTTINAVSIEEHEALALAAFITHTPITTPSIPPNCLPGSYANCMIDHQNMPPSFKQHPTPHGNYRGY